MRRHELHEPHLFQTVTTIADAVLVRSKVCQSRTRTLSFALSFAHLVLLEKSLGAFSPLSSLDGPFCRPGSCLNVIQCVDAHPHTFSSNPAVTRVLLGSVRFVLSVESHDSHVLSEHVLFDVL